MPIRRWPDPASRPPASFDSVILAAVLASLKDLPGASVQRVVQGDPTDVVLVLRRAGRPRALLLSAHPRWSRLHLVRDAPQRPARPFVQFLRHRLEGATLAGLEAPPFERVVTLAFDALEGPLRLVAELTGRSANLIAVTGDTIAGALKPRGAARGRLVLPGHRYEPLPLPRRTPEAVEAADLLQATGAGAADADGRQTDARTAAWRVVLDRVGGLGPAHAWEACLRAAVDPHQPLDGDSAAAVAAALRGLAEAVRARRFAPVLYRSADGRPVAYAAFPLLVFEDLAMETADIHEAIAAVVAQSADADRLEAVRQGLAQTISAAERRVTRALAAVDADIREAEQADRWREQGELILAYLARIAPGATALEVPGYDGTPRRIALDPSRSAVANAQAYFRRYSRAAAAMRRLPARRAALEGERAFLEGLAQAVAQAETEDDLWEVEQDLIAAGLRRPRAARAQPRAVEAGRVFELPGGLRVRVGRSARENDRLTFEVAGPDDLWLHARGVPGAHVIVTGGEPDDAALEAAAGIAAYYSAGRGATRVPVDATRRRHVRRVKGAPPGQVTYTHERTIMAVPRLPGPPRLAGRRRT